MLEEWLPATPSILVAVALIVVPGLVVRLAGWSARSLTPYLFVPVLSVGILAVASNVAGIIGIAWSALPVAVLTLVAAVVAFLLRRKVDASEKPVTSPRRFLAAGGGLALAAAIITAQLLWAFVSPQNISQTFDNIVHLNAIRMALDLGDASAITIGATSDISFYPNGWHSVVTMVAQLSGASVPVAVNAANIVIGALVWPASAMALGAVLFRERAASLAITAALTTAFGAFPMLLFYFGVLYPNLLGYALLPAGLAAFLLLLRHPMSIAARSRQALLLLVAVGAVTLSHPNALLALVACAALIAIFLLAGRVVRDRSPRSWAVNGGLIALTLAGWAGLWLYARTPHEMSRWGPWQSAAQAIGEAALLSPRAYPVTIATAILLVIGLAVIVRRPKLLVVGLPLVAAGFLFVMVSGTEDNFLREMATRPWYNDPYRLAALLPVAGIPVATLGGTAIVDAIARRLRTLGWHRPVMGSIAVAGTAALFAVGAGPNVLAVAADTRDIYTYSDRSALISTDELHLIDRLDETVPEDALIIANPWTGGSVAYALSGREVVERHIFGERSEDQIYVDENLRDIDSDPLVCEAVQRIGADYVLDFGTDNVFRRDDSGLERAGLNDLTPSDKLVLVDSEGPDARLFRIEGC